MQCKRHLPRGFDSRSANRCGFCATPRLACASAATSCVPIVGFALHYLTRTCGRCLFLFAADSVRSRTDHGPRSRDRPSSKGQKTTTLHNDPDHSSIPAFFLADPDCMLTGLSVSATVHSRSPRFHGSESPAQLSRNRPPGCCRSM